MCAQGRLVAAILKRAVFLSVHGENSDRISDAGDRNARKLFSDSLASDTNGTRTPVTLRNLLIIK